MQGLLVRVGADQSAEGGAWNGPIDATTGDFVYVAIPESRAFHPGLECPYSALASPLARHGVALPEALKDRHMHLDPDFDHLTYGDRGMRAQQLQARLSPGDFIAFYAGLADIKNRRRLVYALIGLFVVDRFEPASDVPASRWHQNAHTRRVPKASGDDVIVHARPEVSGRLSRGIPIGEWRDRAYRVRQELLTTWGGLSVRDGYLQRSARLPQFSNPERFMAWFRDQNPALVRTNN